MLNKTMCSGCAACVSICPNNAISMKPDNKGFLYPIIDSKKCNKCGLCDFVCEKSHSSDEIERNAYLCYSNNENIRHASSSGGVFYHLAKQVIEYEGVVFGATFDSDFNVIHKGVRKIEDICLFMGSKYVQSDMKNTYLEVKELVEKNVLVLFSGTPCQTAGLYGFLQGKEYKNLISISLICHGVPSPHIWNRHISIQKSNFCSDIVDIKFREKSKDYSWGEYHLKIVFENGVYDKPWNDDDFFWGYRNEVFLRESCYYCSSKANNQKGDLIIGDYWTLRGCRKYDKIDGVSLVISQTEKGMHLLKECKDLYIEETSYEDCAEGNSALNNHVIKTNYTNKFWVFFEKTNDYKGAISYIRYLYKMNLKKIEEINQKGKFIVLWGTGAIFKKYASVVMSELNVDYICDGKNNRVGEIMYGIPVINTKSIEKLHNVKIIIMLEKHEFILEIIKELKEKGVEDFYLFSDFMRGNL